MLKTSCFLVSLGLLSISMVGQGSPQRGEPRELPRANFPSVNESRFCRDGIRRLVVSNQSFEVGDTWSGLIASGAICGRCWFANAPGAAPPGFTNPDYAHKITLSAAWGDGAKTSLDVTSDHLNENPAIGLTPSGIVGSHTYTTTVDPPKPITISMRAQCADDQGQWWETVDNSCEVPVGSCVAYPATIGVYAPIAPSAASIATPVVHGKIARGALSVTQIKTAPPSGTKIMIQSDSNVVLFPQAQGPSTQQSMVRVAAGQSSANFDIDATLAKSGTKFTITIKNNAIAQPIITQQYTVQ